MNIIMKDHPKAHRAQGMGFLNMFKESFLFTFKNIHHYIVQALLVAIPALVIFGIFPFAQVSSAQSLTAASTVSFYPTSSLRALIVDGTISPLIIVGIILLAIIIGFYGLFANLTMVSLTVTLQKKLKPHYWNIVVWSLKRLLSYFMLALRIFIYTFIWLLILVLLTFTVLKVLSIALGLDLLGGLIINAVLGILGLLSVVLVVLRFPHVLFAKFVFVEKMANSKDSLKESISVATGNWWKIVLYVIGAGIIWAILSGVLISIFVAIDERAAYFVQEILSGIGIILFIVFHFYLYKELAPASPKS